VACAFPRRLNFLGRLDLNFNHLKIDLYIVLYSFPGCERLANLLVLLSIRYLGIPSRGESYVLCDYEFVVNNSLHPRHPITKNDCRDVHPLCGAPDDEVITTATGRDRFSNIAWDNILATILRDHWRYLVPGGRHVLKVLRHVDGETINSPVQIHEDNDIGTR
jgi:hypothetical protein